MGRLAMPFTYIVNILNCEKAKIPPVPKGFVLHLGLYAVARQPLVWTFSKHLKK